jgi:trehalose 6-phosphate synthase
MHEPFRNQIVVLANRAPYRHDHAADGETIVTRSAGGLVTALEPLIQACSGTWVAHAAGSADRGCVYIPSAGDLSPDAGYRLRYVSLAQDEHRGYYYGFANEGLWPLCHAAHVQPVFRSSDFRMYRTANSRFAAAVCDEIGTGPAIVLVQDYHFALAPRMISDRVPLSDVKTFWHIPWPHPRVFRTCPWGRELLDGLLGSRVLGFQTTDDCRNFLDCVGSTGLGTINRRRGVVDYRGQLTRVRAFPVGVEWGNPVLRATPSVETCRERVRTSLGLPRETRLGVGIDRLDYTKGLNEKFLAIERLLESNRDWRGRVAFVQIAEPSRDCLPAYRATRAQLVETCARVNRRFGTDTSPAIILIDAHQDPDEVYRLYRAADVCYVGSLHDGMNLVAKEFVCAREDEQGVLVLSEFAGAAKQLHGALHVNPYAIDETARALARAFEMSGDEQSHRMRLMRAVVQQYDAIWWARQLLGEGMLRNSSSTDETRLFDSRHSPALECQLET